MDRTRLVGIVLIVISAAGFGSGPFFAKPAYEHGVDWMTLITWRFIFAALLSWGWLLIWPSQRSALRQMSRRRVLTLLALGIFYMGNTGTYFAGLETVPASLSALIVYIYPSIVAVLSIRFAHRLHGRRAWFALGLATAGVALAVGGIDASHPVPLFGLLLMISSPIIYAVWIILAARFSGERGATQKPTDEPTEEPTNVPPYDSETTPDSEMADSAPTAAVMLTATAIGWVISAVATNRPWLPGQIPSDIWWALFGVGLVSTALAMQTFYAGARRIGAAQASLVSTVEPIYTITLATLLLHESLSAIQLVGGVMVIIGVVIAQTGQTRRAQ
ncbi:MAG TPA: DMT family transporter [Candidatus Limnocylindria bacterium]|nr:DMT family transporter [Candidatus Limnocylindria bacterium]